jgi:chaperonin GroEL
VAVKAPGFGDRRKEMLRDIAILTAEGCFRRVGLNIRDIKLEWFGRAKSVKVQKENTIIVSGAGDSKPLNRLIPSKSRSSSPLKL